MVEVQSANEIQFSMVWGYIYVYIYGICLLRWHCWLKTLFFLL